jgi:hypothetical protein
MSDAAGDSACVETLLQTEIGVQGHPADADVQYTFDP